MKILPSRWRFLLVGLAICAVSTTATAATMVQMDAPTLVDHSESIVIATVTDLQARLESDGRVYSTVTVEVTESLKGPPLQTILLRQVGGRDLEADITTYVPGMPQFEQQERVFLFLRHTDDGSAVVTGMALGKFRVALGPDDKTDFIIPQIEGLNLVAPPLPTEPSTTTPTTMSLRETNRLHHQTHDLPSFRAYVLELIAAEREDQP